MSLLETIRKSMCVNGGPATDLKVEEGSFPIGSGSDLGYLALDGITFPFGFSIQLRNLTLELIRCSLMGLKLNRCNLMASSFSNTNFRNSDWKWVFCMRGNFSSCDFSGARFKHVDFEGAHLWESSFVGAHLLYCDFTDSVPHGAKFTDAIFVGCKGIKTMTIPLGGDGNAVLELCAIHKDGEPWIQHGRDFYPLSFWDRIQPNRWVYEQMEALAKELMAAVENELMASD